MVNISLNVNIIIKIILFLILFYYIYDKTNTNEQDISDATDNWINAVTIDHDPKKIANFFCNDGNLIGTVSQSKRKGNDIKLYFDYFAKKPGIKVVAKKYNISKVTSDVFINTAFITWNWDGLKRPIMARMTFVFRNCCIFQLHSSVLPELNENLLKISGTK